MKLARRADHRRMAWKNGQGVTEEVATFPAGSGVDEFDWRLSIAHVGTDGPFSAFPGIDRTIALLDGAGLALDLPEGKTVALTADGDPFSFPGEWAVAGRNLGGPTIDLNVMTRRGRCTHRMRRLTLRAGETFTAPGFGWAVFDTPAAIEANGRMLALGRFDALMLDEGERFVPGDGAAAKIVFIAVTAA